MFNHEREREDNAMMEAKAKSQDLKLNKISIAAQDYMTLKNQT